MSLVITGRWRPQLLIGGNDTGGFWRFSATGLLAQLSTGSTAVAADADPVGYALDTTRRSALIQATAGSRPEFDVATNPDSLLVSGAKILARSGLSLDPATGYTVGVSFALTSVAANGHALWTGDAVSNFALKLNPTTGRVALRANHAADVDAAAKTMVTGTRYTLILRATATDWFLYDNGLQIGTGAVGSAAASYSRIAIPSNNANNNFNLFSAFFVNKAIAVSDIERLTRSLSS